MTAFLALFAVGRAYQPPGGDEWKYDVVYRKKGEPFKGLVLEQNARSIEMTIIVRKPGRPTVRIPESIPRQEVERVELLDPKDREVLVKRVETLKKEYQLLRERMKLLDPFAKAPTDAADLPALKHVAWPPDPKKTSRSYQECKHFRLFSTARQELTQLAALDLEELYTALVRFLPPRLEAPPTTILLTQSLAEYQELVRASGHDFLNPAFFDVTKNQIVCGNDLQRLAKQLETIRDSHLQKGKELVEREMELKAAYKNKVPAEFLAQIDYERKQIEQADKHNAEKYKMARTRLFRRLYHEAFHAYLNTFVYPPSDGELPRWFNEGLAQIFEIALIEVGELRVGHVEEKQVATLRTALGKDAILPVIDVLRSKSDQFQVAHASEKQTSDQHYLGSWALAHYLMFGRRVLGTKAMDDYVHALKRGTDPVEAFVTLVGQPLPEFQKEYHQYLIKLKAEDRR